jgi:hypothetical protein
MLKQKLIQCIKQKDQQEIKIQSIIKTIPYFDLYFYTFFSYDDVKLGIMDTEEIEEITMQNQLVSLKYKYIPQYSYEEYMLDKKSIKYLFDVHTYLVRGISKLTSYNIIHFDINNNIIISQEVPLIKISNKCLCLLDSNFIKEYKILFNRHPNCKPFEMHVIYYLLETEEQSISISNIYYLWDEYIKTQENRQFNNDGINFLKLFINVPKGRIIEELLKYSTTWNQYFVSLFILRELKEKHCSATNNFVLKWKEWLYTSTNIDPRNRKNNTEQLDEIIFAADITDL